MRKLSSDEERKKRRRESSRRWRLNNPERAREVNARYHASKPNANRDSYLRCTYGLTRDAFQALLAGQDGKCAVCRTDKPNSHGWCVDHDHKTGDVRGILCHSCNAGIGALRDDPAVLRAAILYLIGAA